MKTPAFIVLPLVLTCLAGCIQHTTVLGTYNASYPNHVTESIQLWRDGTYQQDIGDKAGKVISHMGKWQMGQHEQVEVPGWMNPNSIALGRPLAGTSQPEVLFVVPLAKFQKPHKTINVAY